jgi:hypothetical protein
MPLWPPLEPEAETPCPAFPAGAVGNMYAIVHDLLKCGAWRLQGSQLVIRDSRAKRSFFDADVYGPKVANSCFIIDSVSYRASRARRKNMFVLQLHIILRIYL